MKQQTAVDWLQSEINKYIDYYEGKRDAMPYSLTHLQNAILQAKLMEKEQIVKARYSADQSTDIEKSSEALDQAIKYYNETYGQ
jgi:hypothetical protein